MTVTPEMIEKLRKRAERRIARDGHPNLYPELSDEEVRILLYESHVYQIEIELQNQELNQAQSELQERTGELAKLKDRYNSLYEDLSIPLVTLSKNGLILQANRRFRELVGANQARELINRPFSAYLIDQDHHVFFGLFDTIIAADRAYDLQLGVKSELGSTTYNVVAQAVTVDQSRAEIRFEFHLPS